jgi:hypothetical protein
VDDAAVDERNSVLVGHLSRVLPFPPLPPPAIAAARRCRRPPLPPGAATARRCRRACLVTKLSLIFKRHVDRHAQPEKRHVQPEKRHTGVIAVSQFSRNW